MNRLAFVSHCPSLDRQSNRRCGEQGVVCGWVEAYADHRATVALEVELHLRLSFEGRMRAANDGQTTPTTNLRKGWKSLAQEAGASVCTLQVPSSCTESMYNRKLSRFEVS